MRSFLQLLMPGMDADHTAGRLVIVCGLPGSGKTTLAQQLEAEYGAVRLCPDEWMADLDIDLFDQATRAKIEQLQWQLAQRLLRLGHAVVIEWGTWARDERDTLREAARSMGVAVELRFLDAPVDILWERVDRRGMEREVTGRALTRADIESYADLIERPDADELALYDPPLP
jgi:predicted kinase